MARQGCEALAAMLGKNTTLARLGPPPPRRGPPSSWLSRLALAPWSPPASDASAAAAAPTSALPSPHPHPTSPALHVRLPPPHAAADVSKNVGVQGDDEAKGLLSAAAAKRKAPLNLIMNDEPGQRWSVDGFVDVVEWTR